MAWKCSARGPRIPLTDEEQDGARDCWAVTPCYEAGSCRTEARLRLAIGEERE